MLSPMKDKLSFPGPGQKPSAAFTYLPGAPTLVPSNSHQLFHGIRSLFIHNTQNPFAFLWKGQADHSSWLVGFVAATRTLASPDCFWVIIMSGQVKSRLLERLSGNSKVSTKS